MKIRIYYEDTDVGGIVYHANYIKFCERARSECFFKENLAPFTKDGFFVVSQINAKYISPAKFGDTIEITTKVKECKKASCIIEHKIYKIASIKECSLNEILFEAQIKLAFVNNEKPSKIPENIFNFISTKLI